jgi:hypothetical protein
MHYNRWFTHGDPLVRKCRANGEGSVATGYLIFGRPNSLGVGIRQHRRVMEEVLGRPLTSEEIVHHRDGNKLNNDPTNLAVVSRSEHAHLCGLERVFRLPKEEALRLLALVETQFSYKIRLE